MLHESAIQSISRFHTVAVTYSFELKKRMQKKLHVVRKMLVIFNREMRFRERKCNMSLAINGQNDQRL